MTSVEGVLYDLTLFFFLFSFRDPALRDHAMLWLWIGESRGDCIVGMGVAGRHENGELKEEEEEEEDEEEEEEGEEEGKEDLETKESHRIVSFFASSCLKIPICSVCVFDVLRLLLLMVILT